MADVIESIAKLLPFESWGIKSEIAEPLSVILLTGAVVFAGWAIKVILKRHKEKSAAIFAIMPLFDGPSIRRSQKYFIATQYQNASPARQDEPGFTHLFIARNKLIPFFTHAAFDQRQKSERFYLILGDSGMGKTTFLLNLYLRYHYISNRQRKLKMRLFRMSEANTLKSLESIPLDQAKDTILLLDALDEDNFIYPANAQTTAEKAFHYRSPFIKGQSSSTNNRQ